MGMVHFVDELKKSRRNTGRQTPVPLEARSGPSWQSRDPIISAGRPQHEPLQLFLPMALTCDCRKLKTLEMLEILDIRQIPKTLRILFVKLF